MKDLNKNSINISSIKKIGAGRTAEVFAYDNNKVIKLFNSNFPLKLIEEEYHTGLQLNNLEFRTPKTYEMLNFQGMPGIVFENVTGPSMLKELARKPWLVFSYAKIMAKLHFAMHNIYIKNSQEIPQLVDTLKEKIFKAPLLSPEEKDQILANLAVLKDGTKLCHIDFHPDNIIMSPKGPVVIDWMTARIGNPIADVARTWLLLKIGTLPENKTAIEVFLAKHLRDMFCNRYVQEYKKFSNISDVEFEAWQIPVAAARLTDNVSKQENQNIFKFLQLKLRDFK